MMKKTSLLILAGMLTVLWLSYDFYVRQVKALNYRIFDMDGNVSWAEDDKGIYRVGSKDREDDVLLSLDSWRDFDLTFTLANPRDCGIIFNYRDKDNFHLIYFLKSTSSVAWGFKKDGTINATTRVPYGFRGHPECRVSFHGGRVELTIQGLKFPPVGVKEKQGRIGFVLSTAQKPSTIFHNVRINGILSSGMKVRGSSPTQFTRSPGKFILILFPLFLAMIVTAGYLSWIWHGRRPADGLAGQKPWPVHFAAAAALHFILACLVFWPFLTQGRVLISSYDNIGEIYPLFFFSKHNFEQLLRGQALSLWNPLAHNGVPLFNNHWNMIYYPFNWLIFLFSDNKVMFLVTLKAFLETFLIGVLAYGFFLKEIGHRGWALFSSVAYQLCSILIFSFTVFPTTALYFSMTLFLYLFWSLANRRWAWNYLLLTLAGVLILTAANMAFTFYAVLSLVVLSLYRWSSQGRDKATLGLFSASLFTAFLISAIRILPCFWGIEGSNRLISNFYTIQDRSPLFLRFFIPELPGWFGTGSFNALVSERLNFAARFMNLPSNSQNAFFVYFGILTAILLIGSLFIHVRGRWNFWKWYAWGTIAAALLIQPAWGILSVVFFPFNHYSYHTIFLPAGICALAGHTGALLEAGRFPIKRLGKKIIVALILVQCYILVFLTYLFPAITPQTRIVFLVFILAAGTFWLFRSAGATRTRLLISMLLILLNVFLGILLFFTSTALILSPIPKKALFSQLVLAPFLFLLLLVLAGLCFQGLWRAKNKRLIFTVLGGLVLCIPVLSGVILSGGLFSKLMSAPSEYRIYFIDILTANIKFILVAQIGMLAVLLFKVGRISKRALLNVFLGVLALDLLVFNFRFENITAPFFTKLAFYPKSFVYEDIAPNIRKQMDLVNYRVSSLHLAGLNANKNMIFGLPSYTGTIGYMPLRFSNLLINFGYPQDTVLLYPEDETTSDRLLDLSAVKYVFEENGTVKVRPHALSRLALFYSYKVVNDDKKTLGLLKTEVLDPRQDVLLARSPRTGDAFKQDRPCSFVPITSATSDEIKAAVETDVPAILVFTESFDQGWKAYMDDVRVPVLRANYNFMACYVWPGKHNVRLVYRPESYVWALRLSLAGIVTLLAGLIAGLIIGLKRKRMSV